MKFLPLWVIKMFNIKHSPAKEIAMAKLNELTNQQVDTLQSQRMLESAIDVNLGRPPRHDKYRPSALASSFGWKPHG